MRINEEAENMHKESMIAALALSLCAPLATAGDADTAERARQSKMMIKEFMGELQDELQSAMKAGGPTNAIQVCNTVAPAIAEKYSQKYGWDVGRTSLKYRNADNAPDAWETTVLEAFEASKSEGADPKTMGYAEVTRKDGKKVFRFMKAIPTAEVCTKCHGTRIDEPVKAKLDQFYPQDKARGYKPGDIRGAFTIIQPM